MPNGIWEAGVPLPEDRELHNVFADQQKIYCLSHIRADYNYDLAFDFSTQTWAQIPKYDGRVAQGAMLNGKIYMFGGRTRSGGSSSQTHIYNTQTNTWSQGTPIPDAGLTYNGCVGYGNNIYCVGGNYIKNISTSEQVIACDHLSIYNTATNTWSTGANMLSGRNGCKCAVYNGKIYVFGGCDENGQYKVQNIQIYDIAQNRWSWGVQQPGRPHYYGAPVIGEKAYLISQIGHDIYNFETEEWLVAPEPPTSRVSADSVVVNGKIYLVGGGGPGAGKAVEIYHHPDGTVDPPITPPEPNCNCCTQVELKIKTCLNKKKLLQKLQQVLQEESCDCDCDCE